MSKETTIATYSSGPGPAVQVVRRWESGFGEAKEGVYVGSDKLPWIWFALNDEDDALLFARAVNRQEANIHDAHGFFSRH